MPTQSSENVVYIQSNKIDGIMPKGSDTSTLTLLLYVFPWGMKCSG